jgi:uncharacterized membrane protein
MNTCQSTIRSTWTAPICVASLAVLLVVSGAPFSSVSAAQPKAGPYVFTSFDPPGSVQTFPIGINDSGLISMQYNDAAGTIHTATLEDGEYTVIDVPGAAATLASAANQRDQVALGYVNDPDFYMHQAVWTRGRYAYLPDATGFLNVSPSGMNAKGDIVGVVWSDAFVVVRGYIWNGESYVIFDHPASDILYTLPFGINNRGQIVGQYNTGDGVIHGFLKDGDAYTEIAFPGAPNTTANGISNSGILVGLYGEAGAGPYGFATGSRGYVLRGGVYSTLDYPGALTSFPLGVNDVGEIVGVYQDQEGVFHGYLARPSPAR